MPRSPRPIAHACLALVLMGIIAIGCSATVAPTATPPQTPAPVPSVVAPSLDANVFADIPPLPTDLLLPQEGISVSPSSVKGMTLGSPIAFDLGHCGIYSPVDLDGSLWEPVGGTDSQGGPIDTDAEVGELINATPGEAMLAFPRRLDYRAGRSGVVVVFQRIDGARNYRPCM